VGNSPNAGGAWMKVNDDSEGREGIDRGEHHPADGTGGSRQAGVCRQPQDRGRPRFQFPLRHHLGSGEYPGHRSPRQQQPGNGNGLADVLFGDYNPAGRTSQTWPKSLDQFRR